MQINGTRWFLRGVSSSGIVKNINNDKDYATCDAKYPSLFVDLANNMDWIVNETAKEEHYYS